MYFIFIYYFLYGNSYSITGVENICKSYKSLFFGDKIVLKNISATFSDKITSFIGQSGINL
jgi:hypothetical protein